MLEPSYSQLMEKINEDAGTQMITSRYSIIIATAKRARQIIELINQEASGDLRDRRKVDEALEFKERLKSTKPTSIAVLELYRGDIQIKEKDVL
ncbi:DNA-directed RNA polymerase subunit omega [Candidatus Epulonipiscium viviparus]|uniref:DNA-directed RNA polymerase subunit omega n=1 Tax=Candidatus Epulonipiscium viviparus TaxID=420336 RepID=UPI00016C01ED|nr:DNA-directed RNA polymerase subunit omega [Candidatus Epulopiscium viviparus]